MRVRVNMPAPSHVAGSQLHGWVDDVAAKITPSHVTVITTLGSLAEVTALFLALRELRKSRSR